ncbi:MAG TPA: hypothetical protein VFK80_00950 [Limnochordia bacterium]|nr:hypothetical protein [Limnochordia bacterium]
MNPELTKNRFARPIDAVAAYVDDALGAQPGDWEPGRIRVVAVMERGLPGWHGWSVPVWAIGRGEAAVFSTTHELQADVEAIVNEANSPRQAFQSPVPERLFSLVKARYPQCAQRVGRLLFAERAAPLTGPAAEWKVTRLTRAEAAARAHWLGQLDWDGFAVLGDDGRILSACGVKIKHPAVWELAVGTEAGQRNRGMAKAVVAAATAAVLDAGRVPIYIHDLSNSASSQVARVVGYRWFGTEFSCDFHPAAVRIE